MSGSPQPGEADSAYLYHFSFVGPQYIVIHERSLKELCFGLFKLKFPSQYAHMAPKSKSENRLNEKTMN